MGNLGGGEILVILLLGLLVLGPERLPGAVRQAGKALRQVRKVTVGFQEELRSAVEDPIVEAKARLSGEALLREVERRRMRGLPGLDRRHRQQPRQLEHDRFQGVAGDVRRDARAHRARGHGADRRGRLELLKERLASHDREIARLQGEIAEGERQMCCWDSINQYRDNYRDRGCCGVCRLDGKNADSTNITDRNDKVARAVGLATSTPADLEVTYEIKEVAATKDKVAQNVVAVTVNVKKDVPNRNETYLESQVKDYFKGALSNVQALRGRVFDVTADVKLPPAPK